MSNVVREVELPKTATYSRNWRCRRVTAVTATGRDATLPSLVRWMKLPAPEVVTLEARGHVGERCLRHQSRPPTSRAGWPRMSLVEPVSVTNAGFTLIARPFGSMITTPSWVDSKTLASSP